MDESVTTALVELGDRLSNQALEGKVSKGILITLSPGDGGLAVSWVGVNNFEAMGILQASVTLTMGRVLGMQK